MAAGKELFKLFGLIGMQGVEKTKKQISQVDKQVRKTQKEFDRLGRRVSDVGKVLTKAFTLPLLAAAAASKVALDDATDLNETISKTGEIFGASAKDIEAWANTSATKIGQSKTQAMDAASTFAIFGKSAGLAGQDLVKFSTEFTELASDMSSFFNTEPDEAITAIGAALRGENEPIRRFGVLLDDATMRAKAFELGLVTTTKKALLPQTKVLAAQALILEQTKTAQGDFARTSSGWANQQRILAAQIKNVSASLGQLFIPVALKAGRIISRLVGFAERLVDAWKGLAPATRRTIKGFVLIAGALGPAVFLIGKMIALSKFLVPLLVALKTGTLSYAGAVAVLQKSVLGITLLIGALVALGWFWFSQWDTMSTQLRAVWAKLELALLKGMNAIFQGLTDMVLGGIKLLDKLSGLVPGLSEKLQKATIGILKLKAAMFKDVGRQQAFTNSINEQAEAMGTLTDTVKKAIKDGKEALGLKEENIKKTQKEIDAEKDAAAAEKKRAEDRKKFNADILDQLERLGKEKSELLEIDRRQAVEQAEKLGADVLAVNRLFDEKQRELAQEQIEERIKFEEATLEEMHRIKGEELELLEIEKQEALQKAEELGASELEVKALFLLKEQELRKKIREEELEKDREAIRKRLNMTSKIGNKINNILGKFSDNELQRINNKEKRQIEAIERSGRTEEEKEKAIQKIQADTEAKRRSMERQRAIREKAAALFNIGINTASAIVEALPNIPLSVLVGGLGAAEAVAVATAPLPFLEGGLVRGSEQGLTAQIGEGNQDELVFPLERGVGLLVDGLTERLNEVQAPGATSPAAALAAGGDPVVRDIHLHVGTLVADKNGLKELERKLDTIRIAENQRKGF